jgi:hypothetical protein
MAVNALAFDTLTTPREIFGEDADGGDSLLADADAPMRLLASRHHELELFGYSRQERFVFRHGEMFARDLGVHPKQHGHVVLARHDKHVMVVSEDFLAEGVRIEDQDHFVLGSGGNSPGVANGYKFIGWIGRGFRFAADPSHCRLTAK